MSIQSVVHNISDPSENAGEKTSDLQPIVVSPLEVVALADSVPIRVSSGLGFHVCRETYDRAQAAANKTHHTHFIGNLPSGTEVEGCDRQALLDMGCVEIAWITPEGGAQ